MIIDGKKIAGELLSHIKAEVAALKGRKPGLRVILVGKNPASLIYIKRKTEAAKNVGIESEVIELPEETIEADLLTRIKVLNADIRVDGILVQLPLPKQIDTRKVIHALDPSKDVDGFHPYNLGKLLSGETDGFIPCTPLGIQKMLLTSQIDPAGKKVVILGRSNIVGKPLAALLMQNCPGGNATVTVAHSKTPDLDTLCQSADILIAAMGQPRLIKEGMLKRGAVVIDVGINTEEGHLVGDVDFKPASQVASHITPVPGGVGPMTIACLLLNTLKARKQHDD